MSQGTPRTAYWFVAVVVVVLIAYNLYTGLTLQKLSLFGITEMEFGQSPGRVCSVTGTVYNSDDDQGFPDIRVGQVPPGTTFTEEEVFEYATSTGPDGGFQFDCTSISENSFPRVIALESDGWGGCLHTTQYEISVNDRQRNVNLYVSQRVA